MSLTGHKQTFRTIAIYVRFRGQSGHTFIPLTYDASITARLRNISRRLGSTAFCAPSSRSDPMLTPSCGGDSDSLDGSQTSLASLTNLGPR